MNRVPSSVAPAALGCGCHRVESSVWLVEGTRIGMTAAVTSIADMRLLK